MGRHDERDVRADRLAERDAFDPPDSIRRMLDERQIQV
jgi:hypothetical protein